MILGSLLGVVLVVLAVALTGLVLVTVAGRAIVLRLESIRHRMERRVRGPLIEAVDDERVPSPAGTRAERRATSRLALRMLPKVRGEARVPLIGLLALDGTLARARRRANGPGSVRRARAAYILGLAGSECDVPLLVRLLADRSGEVRHAAARALGKIGDERAAGPLLAHLTGPRGLPWGVVTDAVVSLGPVAVAPARAALSDPEPRVRAAAAEVLGQLTVPAAVPDLMRVLRHDPAPAVRVAAAVAMGHIGAPRAARLLARALSPSEPEAVRAAAAAALARIGGADDLHALVGALGDPVPEVGRPAATALGAAGPAGLAALEAAVAGGAHPAAGRAREELARLEITARARRVRERRDRPMEVV